MSKLLKSKIWITILLLSFSISLSANKAGEKADCTSISSTGELSEDSVTIAISDLKAANLKMTELKYQKEINKELNSIITNDFVIINSKDSQIKNLNATNKKLKKQRNAFAYGGAASLLLLIISLL